MKYYAVLVGRKTGIFKTWGETKNYVSGFPKAKYKSFRTLSEAKIFSILLPLLLFSTAHTQPK